MIVQSGEHPGGAPQVGSARYLPPRGDEVFAILLWWLGEQLAKAPALTSQVKHKDVKATVRLVMASFPYEKVQIDDKIEVTAIEANGDELAKAMVWAVSERYIDNPAFIPAIAQNVAKWKVSVEIKSYPLLNNQPAPDNLERKTKTAEYEYKIERPDQERQRADLPMPDRTISEDGAQSDFGSIDALAVTAQRLVELSLKPDIEVSWHGLA